MQPFIHSFFHTLGSLDYPLPDLAIDASVVLGSTHRQGKMLDSNPNLPTFSKFSGSFWNLSIRYAVIHSSIHSFILTYMQTDRQTTNRPYTHTYIRVIERMNGTLHTLPYLPIYALSKIVWRTGRSLSSPSLSLVTSFPPLLALTLHLTQVQPLPLLPLLPMLTPLLKLVLTWNLLLTLPLSVSTLVLIPRLVLVQTQRGRCLAEAVMLQRVCPSASLRASRVAEVHVSVRVGVRAAISASACV